MARAKSTLLDVDHLRGILDAIERVRTYASDGRVAFNASKQVQDAIIFRLAIIGEAASCLTNETLEREPGIPWWKIKAMRNILVHDYLKIDLDHVWAVVETKLDELERSVQILLASMTV